LSRVAACRCKPLSLRHRYAFVVVYLLKDYDAQHRVGSSKGRKTNSTPQALRDIIPEKGQNSAIRISWQRSAKTFQGYYEGIWPQYSTSASYGGITTSPDPCDALRGVVDFLWSAHILKVDSRRPSSAKPPTPFEISCSRTSQFDILGVWPAPVGGPGDPLKRWGASPPTVWEGLPSPRGRPDP
jgi:hypothetical protein